MSDVSGGRLLCLPYMPFLGNPEKNSTILDWVASHPQWATTASDPDEVRVEAARWLVDPENRFFEVWDGGRLVGLILLSRITRGSDALLHFSFFGYNLFTARRLLWSFIGYAFEEFGLERLSYEAPEHVKGLVSFLRQKLHFRYEGELNCNDHPIAQFLGSRAAEKAGIVQKDAAMWIAKQGSRREKAHWDGKRYRDIHLLRLLRLEYHSVTSPVVETGAGRESEDTTLDVRPEESKIRAVHPT